MAHHFYLPQLTGENIAVPKEHGHWNNYERKIILGISDAITIDEQAVNKGVSSIPDIWARPLLFQSAVRPQSQHPLKKLCTQEWRGLLSLLALYKFKPELDGGIEIVSVSPDNETFSTALKNLAPESIELEKGIAYQWTDILMIRFKGVPVGAFSPTTLVYTGVGYNTKLAKESFPFMDKEGFLAPPETRENGLEYLGEWLYILQQKLNLLFYTDQSNPNHLVVGNLNDMIDDWLIEIRKKLGLKENEPINVKTHKVSEDIADIKGNVALFLNKYNVYQQLLKPLKKDESVAEALISDILLDSRRNRQRKIVVITEKIISQQVNIWGEYRPASLGENSKVIIEKFFGESHGTKIGDVNIGDKGGMWIRPELYFLSNKLLKARQGDILTDSEADLNVKQKYILPFNKEILDFFSAKQIKEILKPSYSEDTNIVKFYFTLPVGGTDYKIEKTYKTKVAQKEDGEIVEVDIPVVELFPNYLGESWRRYFLFYSNAENYSISPLTENESVEIKSREREFKGTPGQKVKIYEINGDNSFPEATEIKNKNNESLGLILIDKKEKEQGLKDKWTIGIDFGTSNTNVFKNRGSADSAERWSYDFPNYYRTLTNNEEPDKVKMLEEFFFPTRKVNLPIPTTLKVYNKAVKESMVLDYFIYYPIEYRFPESVLSDLKWDGAGERNTEYFLESLLFLLLIEVVKNNVGEIDLAASYPKAFSKTNITIFQLEWEKVYDKLLKPDANNSSRILNIHSGNVADNEIKVVVKKPEFRTEGIAAGEYFASEFTILNIYERANKAIAAICLDVGGGTTDISIWYHNKIEFDASVLLAGRQLSNLLQINNRVRELLFSKEAAIALEEKRGESGYFSARLNLILKTEEEQIQNNLVKNANHKDIQWLRQIIALEFGALSFYAAQVCVSTNEKVGGLLSRIASDGINLHWGGNAAKLINWIDFGKYSREGIASKILNATFFKCLDDVALAEKSVKAKSLMQLQSPGHKSEASGGLVVMNLANTKDISSSLMADDMDFHMPDDNIGIQSHYIGIVCGENIELADGNIEFYQPILNKDLFDNDNHTKFKATTLARLIRFVDILNFFGIKNGLFTEDTKIVLGETEKRIIRDGVRAQFIEMQKLSESQRLIEPVFVTEIKILLDIIKSKMN